MSIAKLKWEQKGGVGCLPTYDTHRRAGGVTTIGRIIHTLGWWRITIDSHRRSESRIQARFEAHASTYAEAVLWAERAIKSHQKLLK